MPNTKLAFFRYMLIDQMLRSKYKKYPTKEELLEACNRKFGIVSASTIEKDLNTMRIDFDAPIAYSKKHKGYEYTDKSYKFLSVNLSDKNLLALGFVETILEEFKDLPIFDEFSDAVDKVLDGVEITRNIGENFRHVRKLIQIDKSPYFKGSELLSDLITLLTTETPVTIAYKKFTSDQPRDYLIHPYLLKEFNNMWYLIGYVDQYKEVRIFGIDRIEKATAAAVPYVHPDEVGFDADSFYKYCIGVTALNEKPQKVRLCFSPTTGNYIKSRPIHNTQKVVEDTEKGCIVELELVINYELRMVILSYGANVKVIEPENLAEQIRADLQASLDNYKN